MDGIIFLIKNLLNKCLDRIKNPHSILFDYDCRVCSSAQDILELYSQIRTHKVVLEQYPIATADSQFSARIFILYKH